MNKTPIDLRLHQKSRYLEVVFEDAAYNLPCEYLRVHSPSAEVKGHGPGQEVLQTDKEQVNIVAIEPVGHYAVRLIFSDSHSSGLYSWDILYDLGHHRSNKWADYLKRLSDAGIKREPQATDYFLA